MDEWYSPREINFNRDQMIWLIEHLEIMRRGEYPPDPQGSRYISVGKRKIKPKAYFEISCQLAGEVDFRLKLTGVDGKLLVAEINNGIDRYEDLDYESQMALNFISGWRRRKNYSQWKADRRRRK